MDLMSVVSVVVFGGLFGSMSVAAWIQPRAKEINTTQNMDTESTIQ